MKFTSKWIVLIIIILLVVVGGIVALGSVSSGPSKYDEFAQCLTASGAKMYGTFWCPHCNNQKLMFGTAWKQVNYVECSTSDGRSQLPVCRAAGVSGYPTWEFADASRVEGEMTLSQLSEKTGCELPAE